MAGVQILLFHLFQAFCGPGGWLWESKRAKRKWQVGPEAAVLCCAVAPGVPRGSAWSIPKSRLLPTDVLKAPAGESQEHWKRKTA